ncbi:MAG: hypothetical protein RI973_10 [Bacteroidota bacterium]|jgi:NADH:ubiquinone oxidoreductase subunit 5 (subunit L)/multisubunit Na+/H+ antiporter MnhA subunit
MIIDNILLLIPLVPAIGLLLSLLPDGKREGVIHRIALGTVLTHLLLSLLLTAGWLYSGEFPYHSQSINYYSDESAQLKFEFHFDRVTAVYALVSGLIGTLVILFSRSYMHRDPGYQRFFNNILFFYFGLGVLVFSGNFETLFIGWEIIGISSFMLIGFYRERYLPVKNALKVVSLFRFSDILLLVIIWMIHHAFHRSISFRDIENGMLVADLESQPFYDYAILVCILVIAAIKSAQFPFSSWLPRAMEGPTNSSAIFYGSLSVHIGIFLLIRMQPLWETNTTFRALMAAMGIVTGFMASAIAKVQSSAKTQIAYASIGQIGIMMVEVAAGFSTLALVHFAGNAFLRTYQLLVSPSVLHYLIHDQFYNFEKPGEKPVQGFIGKLRQSVIVLSIKEWNMDRIHFRFLWTPFKWMGSRLSFLSEKKGKLFIATLTVLGAAGICLGEFGNHARIGLLFVLAGLALILRSFAERKSALTAWQLLFISNYLILLGILYNGVFDFWKSMYFIGGITVGGIAGWGILYYLKRKEGPIRLDAYQGQIYEHKRAGLLFLLSSLAIGCFPITPSFIGLDLMFMEMGEGQYDSLIAVVLCFIFMEIAALRIYARVFLGQHSKAYHEIAFRNS